MHIHTRNHPKNQLFGDHFALQIADLVLGSRSVGFTSATFFIQIKMSQSSLN